MTADSFTTGRQRERYYVCLAYHNKGRAVCANGQRLPMREADAAVLEKLRSYVLHPRAVEGAITDAVELLRPQVGTIEARRRELNAQLRQAEAETARLAAAIAAGGELASLVALLSERERARDAIVDQIAALDGLRDLSKRDVGRIEQELRARVREWKALLARQPLLSRQIVAKLVGEHRIVFTPREDGTWAFRGHATLGKLFEGIVLPQVWRPHAESGLSGRPFSRQFRAA